MPYPVAEQQLHTRDCVTIALRAGSNAIDSPGHMTSQWLQVNYVCMSFISE